MARLHTRVAALAAVLAVAAMLVASSVAALELCGSESQPGTSCADIYKARGGDVSNGVYYVRSPDRLSNVPVYCDMEAGGLQMIAKMSRLSESGHTDVYTDWAADGSHGELDASRFSDPWTRTGQYYSRFRKCWNTAECTVDEVVFKVYEGPSNVKTLIFNGEGTNTDSWFQKSKLIASSWPDILTAGQNYFSPAGHGRRRFFIEHSYGGCPADTGWLVATSETWCSWETAESNKPNLVYSSADSMRNQNDADSRRADTFVIYARFGTPITSQRRSCEAGLASARLLSGADYFDPATQRVADASGNGRIATVDNSIDFVPASFAPNEEVASSKSSLVWIETPTNLRYSSASANKVYTSIEPPQVPAAATAIITSVYTFQGGDSSSSGRKDAVLHSLGRDAAHDTYSWDAHAYDGGSRYNDVVIFHRGDADCCSWYGASHGTIVIPLKDDGTFDMRMNMGKNVDGGGGTHHIVIQVNGYFLSDVNVPMDQLSTVYCGTETTANYQPSTGYSALSSLDAARRAGAKAVMASIYTTGTSSAASDHYVMSAGRDNTHTTSTWNNEHYSTNARWNDVVFTHEGDSGMNDVHGIWYPLGIVPLLSDKTFKVSWNMGKNGNTNGAVKLMFQEFGYLSDVTFVDSPANIRLTTANSCERMTNIAMPSNIPADAGAIIVTITTYTSARRDHLVHSFGRNAEHDCNVWSNQPWDLDTYLNDVMITHEGDSSGEGFYYGHSHGSHIIPLKENGRFDAQLAMGRNGGTTSYVTIQVVGYFGGSAKGGPAVTLEGGVASTELTVSAFFKRPAGRPAALQEPVRVLAECDKDADVDGNEVCAWEVRSDPGGASVSARVRFDGQAARSDNDWDLSVAVGGPGGLHGWHHVVLAFDGSTRLARLVVDGVESRLKIGSAGDVLGTTGVNEQALRVGAVGGATALELADVRVYSYVLAPSEVAALSATFHAKQLADGMLLWWRMVGAGVATVTDTSASNNPGFILGSVPWMGGELVFNSNSHAVVSKVNVGLVGDAAFTLTAWLRATSSSVSGTRCFMGTNDPSGPNAALALCVVDGQLALSFGGIRVQASGASSDLLVRPNAWVHVVATRAAGGDKLATTTLFVNGQPIPASALSLLGATGASNRAGPPNFVDARWSVGRGAADLSEGRWTGSVSDVRVYLRALSAQDVATVYDNGMLTRWTVRHPTGRRVSDVAVTGGARAGTIGTPQPALDAEGALRLRTSADSITASVATGGDSVITIAAWLYSSASSWRASGTALQVVALRTPGGVVARNERLAIVVDGGVPSVDFGDVMIKAKDGMQLQPRRWHHLVVTRTAGQKLAATRLYVDGAAVELAAPDGVVLDDSATMVANDARLHVSCGTDASEEDTCVDGFVDDVRVYRRTLSATEVAHLTAQGASQHWRNRAFRGDGSGNHVEGTPYPLGGSSFTVEAWVLSRTPLAEGQGIFEFSDGRHARRIALELQPGTGRMLYSVDNTELGGTPAAQGVLASHEAFPANTWLHVVLTHNADGTASLYWDDHLQIQGAVSLPADVTRGRHFIGRTTAADSDATWEGVIDEFTVWDSAMSPEDILATRGSNSGADLAAVQSATSTYLRFDPTDASHAVDTPVDVSNNHVEDWSSGSNHGSLRCSGSCIVAAPSQAAVCGDGVRRGGEQCDDGNAASGDGCSSTCLREAGFTCFSASVWEADVCRAGTVLSEDEFEDPISLSNSYAPTAAATVSGSSADLRWEQVAQNDGSYTFWSSTYEAGVNSGENWIVPCSTWAHLASNWVVRVEMGKVIDYIKPDGDYNLCDVLAQVAGSRYQWSPTLDGTFVKPDNYHGHLGGSRSNWPKSIDGRQYISFWGGHGGWAGGCCHYSNTNTGGVDGGAWNRAFKLFVAPLPNTWMRVASFDGLSHISEAVYQTGNEAVTPCARLNYLGSHWIMKVTMGNVVDYFRPYGDHTFCSVITSHTKHMWAPEETGKWYSPATSPAFEYYSGHFGGCKSGWSTAIDGRQYVSFWGSPSNSAVNGGCCHDSSSDEGGADAPQWDRAFTIDVKPLHGDFLCDNSFAGGGWLLTRRTKSGTSWGPWNDHIMGTADVGKMERDVLADVSWTVPYNKFSFTETLISTGMFNRWLIGTRASMEFQQAGSAYAGVILRSYIQDSQYTAAWLNRPPNNEDPWISARDHGYKGSYANDDAEHSMLYGEGTSSHGWNHYIEHFGGSNLYVRAWDMCPAGQWNIHAGRNGVFASELRAGRAGRKGLRIAHSHMYVTPTTYTTQTYGDKFVGTSSADTHVRAIVSVQHAEAHVDAEAPVLVPLIVSVMDSTNKGEPTQCVEGGEYCGKGQYRVCFNTEATTATNVGCDEVRTLPLHDWHVLELHVATVWAKKYPGAAMPVDLKVQVAAVAREASVEAWVDEVVGYESTSRPGAGGGSSGCRTFTATSGGGNQASYPSCRAWLAADPDLPNGVYSIDPDGQGAFDVYCRMDIDGWTVFQHRRGKAPVEEPTLDHFKRGIAEYRAGFPDEPITNNPDPDLVPSYWLGLDRIHRFTSALDSSLYVQLYSHHKNSARAYHYTNFAIGGYSSSNTEHSYRITTSGQTSYNGAYTGWNAFAYINNIPFSTIDYGRSGCASAYNGGWWYNGCHQINYNGWWGDHSGTSYADYICDVNWFGYHTAISESDMMMRERVDPNYDFASISLMIDGVERADPTDRRAGLHLAAASPSGSASDPVQTAFVNLGGDGTDLLDFVDGLNIGDIVVGAVLAQPSDATLSAANWKEAFGKLGMSVPAIYERASMAFRARRGGAMGSAHVDLARKGTGIKEATVSNVFECPMADPVVVPDNRVAATFPVALRDGTPGGTRVQIRTGSGAGAMTVSGSAPPTVMGRGGVLNGRTHPSFNLVLQAVRVLYESTDNTRAQLGDSSFRELTHGIEMDQGEVGVVASVLCTEGTNAGFAFPAGGGAQVTDGGTGGTGTYAGVLMAFSKTHVRLWSPSKATGSSNGAIISTVGWGEGTASQVATTGVVRLRMFRDEVPDYDSGWDTMSSQAGAASYRVLSHGLNEVPGRVRVLVRATDGPNKDFVFEGQGMAQNDDGHGPYGGVVYAFDDTNVRLWAPSVADGASDGYIVHVGQGWAGAKHAQASSSAEVRVLAWRDTQQAAYTSPWTSMSSGNAATAFKEFTHDLDAEPARVECYVKASSGANAGFIFPGVRSAQADGTTGAKYGGVLCAYDNTRVRVWAGAKMVSIGDGWAGNTQASEEVTASVQVKVWLSDSATADKTEMDIEVRAVNSPPTLPPVVIEPPASAEQGDVLATLEAHDPDGDTVTYHIRAGNDNGAFALDALTGRLSVADPDQLFERATYSLNVEVSDGTLSTIGLASMTVDDKNHPPALAAGMVLSVSEAAGTNARVGPPINATDPDDGDGLIFSIVGGDGNATFKIDVCTGQVRVRGDNLLDYETKSSYTIDVRVVDDGEPPLDDVAEVTVAILDSNDPPICTDAARDVPENATVGDNIGAPLVATDAEGDVLRYLLEDGNSAGIFALEATTGQLSVQATGLDFETKTSHVLGVVVEDNGAGNMRCRMDVTVTVLDRNDAPSLPVTTYAVDENTANGEPVAALFPHDQDSGDSVAITVLAGKPGATVFSVDASNVLVVADSTALNYETTGPGHAFELDLQLDDGNGGIATVPITVAITNVNDPPVLTVVDGTVSENSPAGTAVAGGFSVTATDEDGDDIAFAFQGGDSSPFAIDRDTGAVEVRIPELLDFEGGTTSYTFGIRARDNGSPDVAEVVKSVTVTVVDVNDAPAIGCTPNLFSMTPFPGYNAMRTVMAQAATNGGVSNDMYYYVEAPTASACSDTCGADDACAAWSFFSDTYYDEQLRGRCYGRSDVTSEMVLDVAEVTSATKTTLCHDFSVAENAASGATVGSTLTATDQDAADTTTTFELVSGAADNGFVLSAAGVLTVGTRVGGLDHEVSPTYLLNVRALDGRGGQSTGVVRVQVTNVDEPPVFDDSTPAVPQGTVVDSRVGNKLLGWDPEGEAVTYTLDPTTNTDGYFKIVGDELQTAKLVSGVSVGATFALTITASSGGAAGTQSTPATVTVTVVDGNVPPVFADAARTVDENSAVDTAVGAPLVVTDEDGTDTHTFEIFGSSPLEGLSLFTVEAATGQLKVARADLDAERETTYTLSMRVTDSGAGSLTDEATVVVTVANVNEPPSCNDRVFGVDEDANTASPIELEAAYACSDPEGDALTYVLDVGGAVAGGRFEAVTAGGVAAASAVLRVAAGAELDYETTPAYTMTLVVSDGLANGETTAQVTVNVRDVNEAPTIGGMAGFNSATRLVTIVVREDEDKSVGRSLIRMAATDPDGNPLSWSITAQVGGVSTDTSRVLDGTFGIDASLGDVRLAAGGPGLDFEDVEELLLTVEVSDGSLTDTAYVRVVVDDINDLRINEIGPEDGGDSPSTPGAVGGGWSMMRTAGDQVVLLKGVNLGPTAAKLALLGLPAFGGVPVMVTYGPDGQHVATNCNITVPNTELQCVTVPGVGSKLGWQVTIDGVALDTAAAGGIVRSSYAAPRLTEVSVTTASADGLATAGGEDIALTGTSLGPDGTTARVWYRNAEGFMFEAEGCSVSSGSTMVDCESVAGVGTALEWQVEVGGQRSSWLPSSISYAPPALTDVALLDGAAYLFTDGDQDVVLTGTNLGPATMLVAVDDPTGARTASVAQAPPVLLSYATAALTTPFDGLDCALTTEHTQLRCTTAAGAGANLSWRVVVNGQASADLASTLSYQPPVLDLVYGPGANQGSTEGGDAVYVSGSGFGTATLNALDFVTYGPTATEYDAADCQVVGAAGAQRVACVTVQGTGKGHSWKVSVAGQVSEVFAADTSYGPPLVATFSGPGSADAMTPGGQIVYVHGSNFGIWDDRITEVSYTRGDEGNHPVYTVQCVVETPHTVLKCESAEGAGADLTWTVVVDEQQSSTPVTNYATPTILGLSWTESAVVAGENGFTFIDGARGDGGELVTVHGENFGQQRHNGGVTYGPTGTEYVLRDVVVVNHTTLQGRTSPGIGVGHSFVVRVSGQASEASEATLSYAAPRIDSVRFCAAGASVCDESGDVATWSDPAAVPEVEVRGAHWGLLDTSSAVQIRLGNPTDGTLRPPITPTSVSPQPGDPDYTPGGIHVLRFGLPSGIATQRALRVVVKFVGSSIPAAESEAAVVNYAPPHIKYVEVTAPCNDTADAECLVAPGGPTELQLASQLYPGQETNVRKLIVHGWNFGLPASVLGDQVQRSVSIVPRDAQGNVLNETLGAAHVLRWSNSDPLLGHNTTVVLTPSRYGDLVFRVKSKSFTGGDLVQESNEVPYNDFSPTIGALKTDGTAFPTTGGAVLTLPTQYLAGTKLLSVTVGTANQGRGSNATRPCPLVRPGTTSVVPAGELDQFVLDFIDFFGDADNQGVNPTWEIECLLPEGEGLDVPVVVVRDGLPGAPALIDYAAPSVAEVGVRQPGESSFATNPAQPASQLPAGAFLASTSGTRMRLSGDNFGLCPMVRVGDLVVYQDIHFCGDLAQAGATKSHTLLEFTLPDGEGFGPPFASTPFEARVITADQTALYVVPVAYKKPTVTSVSPGTGPTRGGTRITVLGTQFGPFEAGKPETMPTVAVGGAPCTNVVQVSHEALSCDTPAGVGTGHAVVVTVAGQSSPSSGSVPRFGYQAPTVGGLGGSASATSRRLAAADATAVDANGRLRGPTRGGFNVTITGTNFGEPGLPGDFCVRVLWSNRIKAGEPASLLGCGSATSFDAGSGEVPSSYVSVRTHDKIVFTFPEGMGAKDIAVVAGDQVEVFVGAFKYHDPVLTSMDPAHGSTDGGNTVTIYGTNLGASGSGVTMSATQAYQVYMRVDFFRGCLSNASTVAGARPLAVTQPYPTRQSVACNTGANAVLIHTHDRIVVRTLGGIGVNREVTVTLVDAAQDGVAGTELVSNAVLFSYDPPVIELPFPNPAMVGDDSIVLSLRGSNYGRSSDADAHGWTADERLVAIEADGEVCEGAQRVPGFDNQLSCKLAPQVVGVKHVNVTVAGQRGSLAKSEPAALFVVCKSGYYGLEGEKCLACPRGANCSGYENFVHTEPVAQAGWFNMNGTIDACHAERRVSIETGIREHCNQVVACEPKQACVGANDCATGYKSVAPIMRCAACADRYYRRAGECVECPSNPWILIVAFLGMALVLCAVGYVLNRKAVNLAFVSIGVDYFQVLAMFANSRITWPPAIKEMFHIFSVFNLNLEITAPECSIPDLGYITKWMFIESLPLAAALIFVVLHVMLWVRKRCCLRRAAKKAHTHVNTLVATLLVMFYFLYLYITRTVLDVFNCAPTDPPDGHEYLEVVFEPCWEAGGIQMTLLPLAIIALFVYVLGYPSIVFYMLYKKRFLVMEDQLLRAKNTGGTRLTNPNAYDVRKRLHKVYYHFKPDYWYWIMAILLRKFLIAFTALMFNKNPAFQLSVALLVMFGCYAMQVKHRPYLSPSEHRAVLDEHERKAKMAAETGATGKSLGVHAKLAASLRAVAARARRHGHAVDMNRQRAEVQGSRQAAAAAAAFIWNYNTVEATLLACAVLVNLAGVMFESNRFATDYYSEQRDAVTISVIFVIMASIVYFCLVLGWEIWVTMCPKRAAKRSMKRMTKDELKKKAGESRMAASGIAMTRFNMPSGGGGGGGIDGSSEGTNVGTNPMFQRVGGGAGSGASAAQLAQANAMSSALAKTSEELVAENQALKAELDRVRMQLQNARRGAVPRTRRGNKEFNPRMARSSARTNRARTGKGGAGVPAAPPPPPSDE